MSAEAGQVTAHARDAFLSLGRGYVRYAPGTLGDTSRVSRYLNGRLKEHSRRRVVQSRFGARFAVDTQDLIQRYLYLFGVWEPNMTRWLQGRLTPGDTFIDVGANIGYYSVLASGLVGNAGRVVAIEASSTFHHRLSQHVRLNHRANVRTINGAVADEHKKLTFVLASSANMGANSIVPYDGAAESSFDIDAAPLPELLAADEIEKARVIKIDVEGAEGSVVRGMAPMLDRLRTDCEITVEVTPDRVAQLGDSADELLKTFFDRGYHAYRMANSYTPESYVAALRDAPIAPVRLRGPVVGETDLIFSRIDAETLA